jgi:hypothetical protein
MTTQQSSITKHLSAANAEELYCLTKVEANIEITVLIASGAATWIYVPVTGDLDAEG